MTIPLMLLAVHFVADFICQSDWMAKGKSSNWGALSVHVAAYTSVFMLALIGGGRVWGDGLGLFLALTFATHFATDAVTSRINSRLWKAQQVHWFFVGVGADQLIHAYTLAWTWNLAR